MIVVYSLLAIFIAWIWIDYYRLIDIYEKESLLYLIITFLFGCMSVFIVLGLNKFLLDSWAFQLNGNVLNDFLYSVIKIGAVEEFAKLIPFLIVYSFLRKEFNEPVDYLVFICASALGFSAVENVLYFYNHGPSVINGRAILSTVGHMFDTALIAYGIILYKYRPKYSNLFTLLLFFGFASLSHGFYDFWLLHEGSEKWGWVITVFYFLISISFFAVILNNALNNSSFFSYKKVIDSRKVAERLLVYYAVVFLLQFLLLFVMEDLRYAFFNFSSSLLTVGFICVITAVRLSRFKLIKGRWQKLKIELPFHIYFGSASSLFHIKVKGDPFNEVNVNAFYEEFFYLTPFTPRRTHLGRTHLAYIEKKIFLKNDQSYYLANVYQDDEKGTYKKMLLKPKTSGTTMANRTFPIVALLETDDMEDLANMQTEDCRFLEWGIIKPRE